MSAFTLRDGVYELELAQPPLNEIGEQALDVLERCLDEVDPAAGRALLIYSSLPRGFCAGADLRGLYAGMQKTPDPVARAEGLGTFIARIHRVMDRLDTLPIATVAAIHGACFGGGFELALACDILVADRTARFCFPELRLGILPCFGGIPRLRREVGNAVMRDLLLSGRSLNAPKAHALGLVSQVVANGKHVEAARSTARQAARFDAQAVVEAKAFLKRLPVEELEQDRAYFRRLAARPVFEEALRSFVERTDPLPYLP